MSSPSARETLIESLGRLTDEAEQKLHGPGWGAFARQKVQSLRDARKWVISLTVTMGLFSLSVPTTAFYHYYDATDSFSLWEFLGLIAGACAFAAVQMGWAVFVYMNWRRQLQNYKALWALSQEQSDEKETSARAETTP